MLKLLIRKFIPDSENVQDSTVRSAYGMLCGIVGIVLNLLLFGGKLLAGSLSGSLAVTADALNNLTDAGSSLVTLLGFHLASQQADQEHPYGHGRMEYIAGLVVAFLILMVGYELGRSSIEKILSPVATDFSPLVVGILICSILVKFYMAFYNRKIGKKVSSAAISAVATDSLSDCAATTVVLLCMLLSHFFGIANLDGWCGLAVAAFILFAGIQAAKDTIGPLLGSSPDPKFVQEIEMLVTAHHEVLGIHDLMVHDYGPGRRIISLHAEVSADGDLLEIHDDIDNIERELTEKTGCLAVIHMDPIVTDDEQVRSLREKVLAEAKKLDSRLSIHDFRMVTGPTHTNLIFDVVIPFDCAYSDEEVKHRLCEAVSAFPGSFFAVICADKPFTPLPR